MNSRSWLILTPLVLVGSACGGSQVHPVAAAKVAPGSGGGQPAVSLSHHSGASPGAAAASCTTSDLSIALGPAGHAAGSTYRPLVFTNKGSSPCTLTGYPGVSFAAPGTGKQGGPAATRNSHLPLHAVSLAPGAHAS